MTDNFEKDINVPSKRPPYEIALMHDHILRLEEELKTKEEECERLKEEMFAHFHKTGEVPALLGFTIDDIANLVKENNTLKAELEQETALKETYLACYKTKHDDIEGIFFKYKQTLTEIKGICKTNVCKHCHSKLKVDDNYCKNIRNCDCYNILQKISEVIENE